MNKCISCGVVKDNDEFPKRDKNTFKNKCKECMSEYNKQYASSNKEKIRINYNNWIRNNPEARKQHQTSYCERNRIEIRRNSNINRRKHRLKRNREEKLRRETDPVYRITISLRILTAKGFKRLNHRKASKTQTILGISFEEAKAYLENKFTEGMSWENHGRKAGVRCWHIDHIMPLISAKSVDDLLKLCHYTNLQPLWEEDNYKKGSKILPA